MLKIMLLPLILIGYIIFGIPMAFADSIYSHPLTDVTQINFKSVQQQLATPTVIKGDFKQVRKMKLLSQPLISSGTFALSQKDGLTWLQTKPFSSTMTVTETKIIQTIMDNPPTIITKKEQPVVFAFSSVFLSVFQGNTTDIQQYFKIYFMGDTQHWEIALTPKGSPFNKAIKNITLDGGQYVSRIIVSEVQDNTMIITLSNVTAKNL